MKKFNKQQISPSVQSEFTPDMLAFIDDLPVQIWFLQDEETYGLVNKLHAEFMGLTKEQMEHKKLIEIMPNEEIASQCAMGNKSVIESKETMVFQEWTPDHRGENRLLEISKFPHFHDDGSLKYIVCTAKDITDIYLTEQSRKASEHKFQTIIENVQDTVFQLNLQGEFTYISPAIVHHAGLKPEQVKGAQFKNFVYPEDIPRVQSFFEHIVTEGSGEIEFRVLNQKREIDWVRVIAQISKNDDDEHAITGVISKITDRKMLEQELAESKNMLQLILDHVPQTIFWKDKNLQYIGANRKLLDITPFNNSDNIRGKSDFDMPWSKNADAFRNDDRKVLHKEKPLIGYTEKLEIDNKERWLRTSKIPLKDSSGCVIGILGMFDDITEEKYTIERLAEQEKNWRTLFNSINDSVFIHGVDGKIFEVNDAACQKLGYEKSELLDLTVLDLDDFDFRENVKPVIREIKEKGFATVETVHVAKDGSKIPVEISARMFEYFGTPAILSVARDISDRKEAEKRKQQILASYEKIIEQSDIGVALIDRDFTLTYVNETTAKILGSSIDDLQGASVQKLIGNEGIQIIQKNMNSRADGKGNSYYLPFTSPDGDEITLHITGNPIYGENGDLQGSLGIVREVVNESKEDHLTLDNMREENLFSICASCKNVNIDKDNWVSIEKFVYQHFHHTFSHGLCPECVKQLYDAHFTIE